MQAFLKELKHELSHDEYGKALPEWAFIVWYSKARFGSSAHLQITDGANDGGIDAVVTVGMRYFVLQAKYSNAIQPVALPAAQVYAFESVQEALEGGDSEFEHWLSKVKMSWHSLYRNVRAAYQADPTRVRFQFVTNKFSASTSLPKSIELVNDTVLAPLWTLYAEGFTPPVDSIDLQFDSVWSIDSGTGKHRTYVGLVDLKQLRSKMADDPQERLFAQNVRTDLATRLNKSIQKSYEKEPETFWLGNNGIYIACSKAQQLGNKLKLVFPSVINGSQTLHAVNHSSKHHSCKVMVRVIELDAQKEKQLLTTIIKRTNSQNPVKAATLAAHDPEQLCVARFLDELGIFYERRQREWQNEKRQFLHSHLCLEMKTVAQWYGVSIGVVGAGTVRSRVAALFVEPNYQSIFGEFGEDFASDAYTRLCLAVLAGYVVNRFIRNLPAAQKGPTRYTQYLLIRAAFDAMESHKFFAEQAPSLIRQRTFRMVMPTELVRQLRAVHVELVKHQRKAKADQESLDLANFTKSDHETSAAYARIMTATRRKALGSALEKFLLEIS